MGTHPFRQARQRDSTTTMRQIHRVLLFLMLALAPLMALAQASIFGSAEEPLAPDVAFMATLDKVGPDTLEIGFAITDEYYLYRDKTHFRVSELRAGDTLLPTSALKLGEPETSPADIIHDDFFGEMATYRGNASYRLPYTLSLEETPKGPIELTLDVEFQGCADIGLCYPPTTTVLFTSLPAAATVESETAVDKEAVKEPSVEEPSVEEPAVEEPLVDTAGDSARSEAPLLSEQALSEQDRLSRQLGQQSLWLNALAFLGLGLLLAFTPCVLPMVPILSSIIVGQGEIGARRAFLLSLVYVLTMALTYAVLGVFTGLGGYNVQAFLQNPWVLSVTAVIFVLLALAMFGAYELQLPGSMQARLSEISQRQKGGRVGGVIAMGFLSTLIVGPCVTAPLAGALIYIADTGNAMVGGVALFALGLGMGAPLLAIGTSAGHLLPKAGAWMERMRHLFGFLLVGMAIYMISRFLDAGISMALFAVLAVVAGISLGATENLSGESGLVPRIGKALAALLAIYGVALLVGVWSGSTSYLRPLAAIAGSGSAAASDAGGGTLANATDDHALPFRRIKGLDGLEAALADASDAGQNVMLDFYADWCVSCKEMEAFTFSDDAVQARLANTLLLQADVTANDAADQALLRHFRLFGPPAIIFYDASGEELPAARLVGFMPADRFSEHLDTFLSGT